MQGREKRSIETLLRRLLWVLFFADIAAVRIVFDAGSTVAPRFAELFIGFFVAVMVLSVIAVLAAAAWCFRLKRRGNEIFGMALPASLVTIPILISCWMFGVIMLFGVPIH